LEQRRRTPLAKPIENTTIEKRRRSGGTIVEIGTKGVEKRNEKNADTTTTSSQSVSQSFEYLDGFIVNTTCKFRRTCSVNHR
jgi:hypothetical protein